MSLKKRSALSNVADVAAAGLVPLPINDHCQPPVCAIIHRQTGIDIFFILA